MPTVLAIEELIRTEDDTLLIAIDGRTGAGKTTISKYLHDKFGGNLFHLDDFYLQSHQRTPERLREVGGNVDYERFKEEVLAPILRKEVVHYRPFNYHTMDFDVEFARDIPVKRLNIIEGTYCLNPYFEDPYDLRIFMDVKYKQQIENVIDREGTAELDDYIDKWIPKTDIYIERMGIQEKCDITIEFTA
ncbi:MAG TPA: hypothetical protein DIW34_02820 [Oribacterium sp.]|nr:hypothetical protein [Oribacterium sp.]